MHKESFRERAAKDFKRNKYIYLILLPVIAFYIIFHYIPMYGAVIAFKDFKPGLGIIGSPWAGIKYFKEFLGSYYFWRLVKNTFAISFYNLIFGFPAPIIFALLINEIANSTFKKTVQTVTYLPHFISTVIICGLIIDFTGSDGIINDLIVSLGGERSNLLTRPELFRTIYISSEIWTNLGWGSIIYLAALTNIDPSLYEAAIIDGANRWKQTIHITIPGIAPTIMILLILQIGSMMSVGWEKIILLYNPLTYETADVISSFVYRRGLINFDYSYSAAVGLFNSIVNFVLLISANTISKKVNDMSLW
ncbi:ABC transporter permease [Xylanivirga thermophila]|jgi:putative aldouronate transport system permease protein|uniref:ABC transporter permease n=1 Tax=Xylanivirga thermophila TaxID=2496273 RepID=UPI00101B9DF6|nr:ABC transporter permease subunit [Xylanivirga thermophila]